MTDTAAGCVPRLETSRLIIDAHRAHGQGFASEAVVAALAWLDGQAQFSESVCLIAAENLTSSRLAQRHGFGSPTMVTFMESEAALYRRDRASSGSSPGQKASSSISERT